MNGFHDKKKLTCKCYLVLPSQKGEQDLHLQSSTVKSAYILTILSLYIHLYADLFEPESVFDFHLKIYFEKEENKIHNMKVDCYETGSNVTKLHQTKHERTKSIHFLPSPFTLSTLSISYNSIGRTLFMKHGHIRFLMNSHLAAISDTF